MYRVVLATLALAGCELLANIPSYTASSGDGAVTGDGTVDDGSTLDMAIDAAPECTLSTQCTAPETCIRGQCGLCDSDADCGPAAENVCLPTGTCAATNRIAYAAPNGTGAACSLVAPCTIEQAFATAAGSPAIDIVKLGAGNYQRTEAIVTTDTLFLAGEGATLTAGDSIQMLRVNTGGSLTIVGLTLVGNQQYNALCFGAAGTPTTLAYVRVMSTMGAYGIGGFACTIDVTRSTIVQQSQMGAYISQGSARFLNSVIMGNGGQGGIFMNSDVVARIEHSTIAGNTSNDTTAAGITCGTANETIVSSIIWGNAGTVAIDPACAVNYSVVDPTYAGGTGNVRLDPLFVAAGDFHIQATSPARGAADPASAIVVDRDFEIRPQGGAKDCGADEVP